jgi:hypothetical protein
MKTITFKSLNGDAVLTSGEKVPMQPTRLVTVHNSAVLNPQWIRNLQLSSEFVFIKRYGSPTVGVHVDDLIALAIAIEPKLSWPPLFKLLPQNQSIKAGETANLSIETVSELPDVTYQWQSSIDGKDWTDIKDAVSGSLAGIGGGFYRCVATNAAGSSSTEPAHVKLIKPKA